MRFSMRRGAAALAAALLALGVACSLDVTNPGPVQDEFLADSAAQPAIVSGAGRALAQAVNWIAYTGAAITREVHPAGSTGSFGINPLWQRGELNGTIDRNLNEHWEQAQRARWLAESGITRLEALAAKTNKAQLAQIYLWAGYSNRLLGENMCQAVFDGSAPQANIEFFKRAEQQFAKANEIAAALTGPANASVATAALAGRAAVRVFLGNWTAAVQDAGRVANTFVYRMPYFNIGEDAQRNRIQFAVANTPYRAHTQWSTVYEAYYNSTKDPRVPFTTTTLQGDAAIECCGKVKFFPQAKYATAGSASAINLSSGREMRLIEAEALLRSGDMAGAMAKINALRTASNVAAWPAPASITEAWARLKRERGIELWLEGRRMGDMRRWKEGNTPGALDPLELPSGDVKVGSHLARQDLCFPIPPSEWETNPNVPKP